MAKSPTNTIVHSIYIRTQSDPSPSPANEQDAYGMQDTNREGCERTENIKTTDQRLGHDRNKKALQKMENT